MPAIDVIAAGGWKNWQTIKSCYQHATDAGVLEVMTSPVKLRDQKAGSE